VGLVEFYVLFIGFCVAVAWYFAGFPFVQRLDDRLFSRLRRVTRRGRGHSASARDV